MRSAPRTARAPPPCGQSALRTAAKYSPERPMMVGRSSNGRLKMKSRIVGLMLSWAIAVAAQSPRTSISGPPDLSGVWQGPYTPDLTKPLGHDLPYTAEGAERFKNVVHADDPSSYCLPVGPARGIQAPMPFQIVQTP